MGGRIHGPKLIRSTMAGSRSRFSPTPHTSSVSGAPTRWRHNFIVPRDFTTASAMRRRDLVPTVNFTRFQTARGLRGPPRVLVAYTKGAWSRLATRFSGSLSAFVLTASRRRHAWVP
ncbi:hypothetical protein K523DRAFT_4160 [Schizophyllum commune Tattone D]|nr:hypothetical protein K523DRAFT_4160 [Schizophyllum commune Tattone D]